MAGLPLPSVFISDHDASTHDSDLFPGRAIVCQPLSWTTGLRVARSIVSLGKWIVETDPFP